MILTLRHTLAFMLMLVPRCIVEGFIAPRPLRPTVGANTVVSTRPTGIAAVRDPDSVHDLTSALCTSTMMLPMILAPFSLNEGPLQLLEKSTDALLQPVMSTASSASFTAEVMSDVAHLVLDLFTLLAPTASSVIIRAAGVLGHVFAIGADYLPDHYILPEEWIFQVCMLAFSWVSLLQVAVPHILTATSLKSSLQLRDAKAYLALFAKTGMSWKQFKMIAACAMDWIDVRPHEHIAGSDSFSKKQSESSAEKEDEYVFWLFKGDMVVQNGQGNELYSISSAGAGQRLKEDAAQGLLGEIGLLQQLEKMPSSFAFVNPTPAWKAKAGSSGATVLRMHTSHLGRLAQHDQGMTTALRTLLFQGLSAKLATQFEAATK